VAYNFPDVGLERVCSNFIMVKHGISNISPVVMLTLREFIKALLCGHFLDSTSGQHHSEGTPLVLLLIFVSSRECILCSYAQVYANQACIQGIDFQYNCYASEAQMIPKLLSHVHNPTLVHNFQRHLQALAVLELSSIYTYQSTTATCHK
jgi:hypothetical protein